MFALIYYMQALSIIKLIYNKVDILVTQFIQKLKQWSIRLHQKVFAKTILCQKLAEIFIFYEN